MGYYFILIAALLFVVAIGECVTGKMLNLNFIGVIATRNDLRKEYIKIVFTKFVGYLSILVLTFWVINLFPAIDFFNRREGRTFVGIILLFILLPVFVFGRKFKTWVRFKKIKNAA